MLEPSLLRYNLIRFGDANIAKKPLIPNFLWLNIAIFFYLQTNSVTFSNKKKEEKFLLFNDLLSNY